MYLRYATCLLLATLSACATHSTAPDWVSGDSKAYPAAQYLTGHGEADTREAAQDHARADIAKVFQVTVRASTDNVQRVNREASGASNFEQQSSLSVSSRTSQVISGIQIAEVWQDPATASYHALAVLPRAQAATALRQQMGELDEATSGHVTQARKETAPFFKVAALARALKTQQERDELQKRLQVVDGSGRGATSEWNSADLQREQQAALRQASIAPRIKGDTSVLTTEMLAGALAQAGFESHPDADYTLQGELRVEDLGKRDGWYWVRGNLEITLTERANNKVRGTKLWNVKGNAQDRSGALRRLQAQVDAVLKEELQGAVVEMVTGK